MTHKYDLTFLNCIDSIYNLFDSSLFNPSSTKSFELKNNLRKHLLEANLLGLEKEVSKENYLYELFGFAAKESHKFNKVSKIKNYQSGIFLSEIEYQNFKDKAKSLIDNSGIIDPEEFFDLINLYHKKFRLKLLIQNEMYFKFILGGVEVYNLPEINFVDNRDIFFQMLVILFCDYGTIFIEEILDYHFSKVDNKKDFIKYLKKYIKIIPEKLKNEAILSEIDEWIKSNQNSDDVTLDPKSIWSPFENNFDNINPTEIYKHFKAGLVEKKYLTEQQLNMYLKAAFELKTIPETLFKIKDAPNKAAIEAVFYLYYKNVAGKIHGRQNQYAALLGDYFEGFKTATVSSNFSKSVY